MVAIQGATNGGMIFVGILLLSLWIFVFALVTYRMRIIWREAGSHCLNIVFLPIKLLVLGSCTVWVVMVVALRLQFWFASTMSAQVPIACAVLIDTLARPIAIFTFCYMASARLSGLLLQKGSTLASCTGGDDSVAEDASISREEAALAQEGGYMASSNQWHGVVYPQTASLIAGLETDEDESSAQVSSKPAARYTNAGQAHPNFPKIQNTAPQSSPGGQHLLHAGTFTPSSAGFASPSSVDNMTDQGNAQREGPSAADIANARLHAQRGQRNVHYAASQPPEGQKIVQGEGPHNRIDSAFSLGSSSITPGHYFPGNDERRTQSIGSDFGLQPSQPTPPKPQAPLAVAADTFEGSTSFGASATIRSGLPATPFVAPGSPLFSATQPPTSTGLPKEGGFGKLWQQSLRTARSYVQGVRDGDADESWEKSARWSLVVGTRYFAFVILVLVALYVSLAIATGVSQTVDCDDAYQSLSETTSCYSLIATDHYVTMRPRIFDALSLLWFGMYVAGWCFCGVRLLQTCRHRPSQGSLQRRFVTFLVLLWANWIWQFVLLFDSVRKGKVVGFCAFLTEVLEAALVIFISLTTTTSSRVVWGSSVLRIIHMFPSFKELVAKARRVDPEGGLQ